MSITFNLVPSNAAASAVFVEQEPVNRGFGSPVIPHKLLLIGQYNTGKTPTDNTAQLILDVADAKDRYGTGSMLALMVEAAFRKNQGVPIYAMPVADDVSADAATGTIVISGTATAAGTLAVYIAGRRVPVAVAVDDSADTIGDAIEDAVTADVDLPVTASNTAGTVTFTSKWAGAAGNQIKLETNYLDSDETPAGLTVTVTDMGDVVAGATNPDIETALDGLGDTWYTEIVCPYVDSTSIGLIESAGDDRIDPGVKRPFVGFVGYTDTSANLITALDSRNSQWTTIVPVHGSSTPAFEIGAAIGGLYAGVQQATPGRPVKNRKIPGVLSASGNDLTYSTRDTVVKAGGSHTYNQEDGTVTVGDLVTTKTTTTAGAATDDWRFTIIISNIQYKIYALETTYLSSPFDAGIVLADGGPAGPNYAIRPSTVKAYAVALIRAWGDLGLSTDIETIIAGTTAEINGANPGRIDLVIPDIPSAGLRILAAKLEWAFLV